MAFEKWEDTLTPEQREVYEAADKMLEVLERVIPKTTIDYYVEEMKRQARTLSNRADRVITSDKRAANDAICAEFHAGIWERTTEVQPGETRECPGCGSTFRREAHEGEVFA